MAPTKKKTATKKEEEKDDHIDPIMEPSTCLKIETDFHNKILLLPNNQNIELKNLKFLPSNHLGMTAFDTENETFYHIEKHLGEKNRSIFIHDDDLFDGTVYIFKKINPFFVMLTKEFIEFRVPDKKWVDKNVKNDKSKPAAADDSENKNNSIIEKFLENASEDKNIQNCNKFFEFTDENIGLSYPFNNLEFLKKITKNFDQNLNSILEYKEIDIGEDKPLKTLRFSLQNFTNFVKEKLEKLQSNKILVNELSRQPKREAWLILREFLPRKSWAFLEHELEVPADELLKMEKETQIMSLNDEIQANKENIENAEPESKKAKVEGKAEKSLKKVKVKSKNIASMFAKMGTKKEKKAAK